MHKECASKARVSSLRAARLSARMSQEELAVRAGITRGTVAAAEKIGAQPSMRVQRAIAEALPGDVHPDELWPLELEAA